MIVLIRYYSHIFDTFPGNILGTRHYKCIGVMMVLIGGANNLFIFVYDALAAKVKATFEL